GERSGLWTAHQALAAFLGESRVVLGMPAPNVLIAAIRKTLLSVLTQGLEQLIPARAAGPVLDADHRAVDQPTQTAKHVDRYRRSPAHGFGSLEVEAARKCGKAPEERLLGRIESVIAPVHGRPQRLMAGHGRAAATREQ